MRPALLAALAVFAIALTSGAHAAGGGGGAMESAPSRAATPAAPAGDPNFARAKAMIEAKDYRGALPVLHQVVTKDPKNADAYNLMGFALRKAGDANASLQYYTHALTLDPKHVGAHEYIGEAYLMLGRLPEAEQHLARLDTLCVFGCTEQRMLKAAIADYKAGKRPTN